MKVVGDNQDESMYFELTQDGLKKMPPEEASAWRARRCYSACEGILDAYALTKGVEPDAWNDKEMRKALNHIHLAQRHFALSLVKRGKNEFESWNRRDWMPDWIYSIHGSLIDWWWTRNARRNK